MKKLFLNLAEHAGFVRFSRRALFFDCIPTVRYRVAIMAAYGAGLRVSEVVSLKVSDVDSKRMVIRVEQGKGKKDRYTLLSPRLLEILRFWWRSTRPEGKDALLFPAWRTGKHLSAATLQRACRDAAKQAGLTKRVTPHSMRHAFATHLLESGTDIRVIQALLGNNLIQCLREPRASKTRTTVASDYLEGNASRSQLITA